MKTIFKLLPLALLLALCATQSAVAVTVEYESTFLGDSRWQYDYTIINDLDAPAIYFVDILFSNDYQNLEVNGSPDGWLSAILEPAFGDPVTVTWGGDFDITLDDFLSIGPGETLDGFSVLFDWNYYDRAPESPLYDLWGGDFEKVSTNRDMSDVPEPGTLVLFGMGLAGLAAYYRTRKR